MKKQPYRVLVIDDSFSIRQLYSFQLRKMFETVETATNGIEARPLFEKHHYDIVLCDYYMPGLNGIELIKKLNPCTKDTLFILCSGREDLQKRASEAGYDMFVRKPLAPFKHGFLDRLIEGLIITK